MELLLTFSWIPVLVVSLYAIVTLYRKQHHLHTTNLALQQDILSVTTEKENLVKEKSLLLAELSVKNSELQKLHDELQQSYSSQSSHEHSYQELQSKLHALESQLLTEQRLREQLQSERNALSENVQSLNHRLQQQITSGTSIEEQLRSKIDTLELYIADLKKNIEELHTSVETEKQKNTLLTKQVQQHIEEKKILTDSITQTERQYQQKNEELIAVTEKFLHEEDQRKELEEKNDNLTQQLAELQETIRQHEGKNISLQNDIEQLRFILQETSAGKSTIENTLSEKETSFRSTVEKLEQTISELHNKNSALETALSEEKNIRSASESALQESKEKLYGVIKELEKKLESISIELHNEQKRFSQQSELNKELFTLINNYESSVQSTVLKTPLASFVINEQGNLEFANEQLCSLVRIPANELVGQHFSFLFPEEDREFYKEQWNNKQTFEEQFHGDAFIVSAATEKIPVYCSVAALPNKRYIGFLLDKTKEREAEFHSRIATEKENELHDLKSRFILMVTHQLRTALVTIASNTELLERFMDKWSNERRYQAFYRINDSLKQMKDLLHNVVFTTNAGNGTIQCVLAEVNLEKLCQAVAKEIQSELESNHRFIFIEHSNLKNVRLDEKLVATILRNLLSNAFKYSSDETEVTLRAEITNGNCVISIEDHGIGIAAADQLHLFETFFRGSNVGNIFGTGLGLTIAKQCAEIHGGTISIESALNKGTTATVTIPTLQ